MDKQEQIEKMATIIACGDCGCASWDCPNDEGIKCYAKEKAKSTANLLVRNGYINGADFVEWLKSRDISSKDYPHLEVALCFDDTREELTNFIDEALNAYLKGE